MKKTSRTLRVALAVGAICGLGVVAISCGTSQGGDADEARALPDGGVSVGTETTGLSKCNGGTLGDADYCSNTCICNQGEGDCDGPQQCAAGLACSGKGTYFCYGHPANVCAPQHCNNKVQDGDETQPDCGGSCGTCCPTNPCLSVPALGQPGHCTTACPCAIHEGGCSTKGTCTSEVCAPSAGGDFGFAQNVGVCIAATCSNQMMDGDETGVDCGGSCLPCTRGSTFSGTGNDLVMGVAYDSAGNLYVAGRTSSPSIDFGTGALASHGNSDIFLAKFNSAGKNLWAKRIGGSGDDGDAAVDVTTDISKNVYLVGNFYTTVDFGGGPVTVGGTSDAFIAKYNASGTFTWVKHYGGTGGNRIRAVATDSKNNIVITGGYQNSISFGGSTFNAASAGMGNVFDIFVAKLNAAGAHLWSKSFGSTGNDEGVGVATDGTNVYVGGFFADTPNFGTGTLTSAGSLDAFGLALSTSTGATVWVDQWGGTSDDRTDAVALGKNSNVLFGGDFKHSATFGSTKYTTTGGTGGFVASAGTSNGTIGWSDGFLGTGGAIVLALAVRSDGAVAATGSFQSAIDFGGGTRTAAGGTDVFLTYLTSAGAYSADSTYGGSANDQANAVATTTGLATIGGQYASSSISFGGASLTNAGGTDAFWAKVAF